ncbi:hypothetical protein BJV82DRAFT_485100, partial [Fennellomyces sp. T-0311]
PVKRTPTKPPYDIARDTLNQPADITIGQLIQLVPFLKRQLIAARRRKTYTVAVLDETDNGNASSHTTALYSIFHIYSIPVKTLIDSSASK